MFDFEFMRTAFLAGGIVAVAAGAVGFFLVLRNLVFAGHALSHVGFAGATGSILIGIAAFWGLLAFSVAAAVAMGLLGDRLRHRDVAIGIVLALGFGVLFLSLYTASATEATAILFGNLLAIGSDTFWGLLAMTVATLLALAVLSRPLLFATLEPELAEAKGVSLRLVSVLFLTIGHCRRRGSAGGRSASGVCLDGRAGSGGAAAGLASWGRRGCGGSFGGARNLGRARPRLCHRLANHLLDRAVELPCLFPEPVAASLRQRRRSARARLSGDRLIRRLTPSGPSGGDRDRAYAALPAAAPDPAMPR